jgi:hypothetical protein
VYAGHPQIKVVPPPRIASVENLQRSAKSGFDFAPSAAQPIASASYLVSDGDAIGNQQAIGVL